MIMEKKVLVKKSLTFLAESPTPNCENCNIPSPQHVRIALRCADIFYIQASDIGTGVTHRPLFRFRKTQI